MFTPDVDARIEQADEDIRQRVFEMSLRFLEVVAPETAQAEIIEIVFTAF